MQFSSGKNGNVGGTNKYFEHVAGILEEPKSELVIDVKSLFVSLYLFLFINGLRIQKRN